MVGLVLVLLVLGAAEDVSFPAYDASDLDICPISTPPPDIPVSSCPFARLHKEPSSYLEVLFTLPLWTEAGLLSHYRAFKTHYPVPYLLLFYLLLALILYKAISGQGRPESIPQRLIVSEERNVKECEGRVKAQIKGKTEEGNGNLKQKVDFEMQEMIAEHHEFSREIVESHSQLIDYISSLTTTPDSSSTLAET